MAKDGNINNKDPIAEHQCFIINLRDGKEIFGMYLIIDYNWGGFEKLYI